MSFDEAELAMQRVFKLLPAARAFVFWDPGALQYYILVWPRGKGERARRLYRVQAVDDMLAALVAAAR